MLCQIAHIIKHMMLPVTQFTLISAVILQPGSMEPSKPFQTNQDYMKVNTSSSPISDGRNGVDDMNIRYSPVERDVTVFQIVRDATHRLQ